MFMPEIKKDFKRDKKINSIFFKSPEEILKKLDEARKQNITLLEAEPNKEKKRWSKFGCEWSKSKKP